MIDDNNGSGRWISFLQTNRTKFLFDSNDFNSKWTLTWRWIHGASDSYPSLHIWFDRLSNLENATKSDSIAKKWNTIPKTISQWNCPFGLPFPWIAGYRFSHLRKCKKYRIHWPWFIGIEYVLTLGIEIFELWKYSNSIFFRDQSNNPSIKIHRFHSNQK